MSSAGSAPPACPALSAPRRSYCSGEPAQMLSVTRRSGSRLPTLRACGVTQHPYGVTLILQLGIVGRALGDIAEILHEVEHVVHGVVIVEGLHVGTIVLQGGADKCRADPHVRATDLGRLV